MFNNLNTISKLHTMCQSCDFFCKTIKKMYDPNNPNNFNNCKGFLIMGLIITPFLVAGFFIGTYTMYGLTSRIYSGYNYTTGCPLHKPDCESWLNCSATRIRC